MEITSKTSRIHNNCLPFCTNNISAAYIEVYSPFQNEDPFLVHSNEKSSFQFILFLSFLSFTCFSKKKLFLMSEGQQFSEIRFPDINDQRC